MLIRVDAPHMVAGAVTDGESRVIVRAADTLKWTIGKTVDELWRWCRAKGYACERADEPKRKGPRDAHTALGAERGD